MTGSRRVLTLESLTAAAFAPFGDVIDTATAARHFTINQGFAERFDDLARIDVGRGAGYSKLSIFRAQPRALPAALMLMERHPLGSQAFMPLSPLPFLVVVCEGGETPDLATLRCFKTEPGQGVNYAAGTWHHPLLALQEVCDFLVIDRGSVEDVPDCDEFILREGSFSIAAEGTATPG